MKKIFLNLVLPTAIGVIAGEVIRKNNLALSFILTDTRKRIVFNVVLGLAATGLVSSARQIF